MKTHPQNKYSDGTRHALIMAGLELFGEHGFKATTTRMLAERADANVSAIPYYFGGKEGLYMAVIEYIGGRLSGNVGPAYASIQRALEDNNLGRDEAEEHIVTLLGSLAHLLLENEEARRWAVIVIKEQLKPSPAFDIIYDNVMRHVHGALCGLIARLTGREPDDPIVIFKAHTLLGQVFIFLSGQETLLRRLGVKKLEKEHVATIKELLGQHAVACIHARAKA